MDPFTPKPSDTNLPLNTPQPRSSTPPPLLTNTPKKPNDKSGRTMLVGLTILYVIVLIVGVFTVYAWQNNKVALAQKNAASAQTSQKIPDESSNIESDKYAAVFLAGGQVYFGNIDALNPQFLTLSKVYYLRTNGSPIQSGAAATATNDVSLVKLGCELHGPTDKMVINRTQVIFWENLKNDGQVSKAIVNYVKQNPSGQHC